MSLGTARQKLAPLNRWDEPYLTSKVLHHTIVNVRMWKFAIAILFLSPLSTATRLQMIAVTNLLAVST